MLNARDFFKTADDRLTFDITLDDGNRWIKNLGTIEIIRAIEHASLFEERITVDRFSTSIIEDYMMYVFLKLDRPETLADIAPVSVFLSDLMQLRD